jgi:hypothetical protein
MTSITYQKIFLETIFFNNLILKKKKNAKKNINYFIIIYYLGFGIKNMVIKKKTIIFPF